MISRRSLIVAAAAMAWPGLACAGTPAVPALSRAFKAIERRNGGRLGVAVLDTADGSLSGYRMSERFPMCSTFKVLLVAAVLARVDRGWESVDRKVAIPSGPLPSNSPLTAPHAGDAMSVADLCHAALTRSDNEAANLLLDGIGGPVGFTRYARSIGDRQTRLDRRETALNEAKAGDPRDSTTPEAMAHDLAALLLGDVLSPASRGRLGTWMEESTTGRDRLRAGLPDGWRAADKTGSNGDHTSNDIAVFWPKDRAPLIVTAYITLCPGAEEKRAGMLAEIGRLARGSFS